MRTFLYAMLLMFLGVGCVQVYEFNVNNVNPSLVIEGQISDISYNDYKKLPADGRFFTVKLRWTSRVTNVRDQLVKNASVVLHDDRGNSWNYTSSNDSPGKYILNSTSFRAEKDVQYQLNVALSDGEVYYSDWEKIPDNNPGPMGAIDFEEMESQQFIYRSGKRELKSIRSIDLREALPKVTSGSTVFYKWDFTPTWIFRATLLSPQNSNYRCWITDPYYLSDYTLVKDKIGNYKQDLVNIQVDFNDRFWDKLSVLISQYSMTENYYNYWQEIHEQIQRKGLFDPPPFNLKSNLHSEDPNRKVFGYFGVVGEQGKRWYFTRLDLSYKVQNTWREGCERSDATPFSPCLNCFNANDYATNIKPEWWDE